jgi:hypothetical protein
MVNRLRVEIEVHRDQSYLRIELGEHVIAGHWTASLPILLQRLQEKVQVALDLPVTEN